ncbi:MAG TPA: WecB/TagA/CpsF family glycosyltransferase [Acidobacteriaceae bacterium]|nr:WecB/TagA/CpsF family glycosyltransferase [Acidobacteriaceae bacterium]
MAEFVAHRKVTILGVDFFGGSVSDAVTEMERGGLLVVPAAPALKDIDRNAGYREALLNADVCIPDSAFMVMIWNRISREKIQRLSGLLYLRELLQRSEMHRPGNVVWIMASPVSAARNIEWLKMQGIEVPEECVYLAPMYGKEIEDPRLLELLERLRPEHVLVTVGGGTQERLGLYLKQRLSYRPAIHCIGAAIAFLSGDQVGIPVWADKLYLGWLFRTLADPKRFGPRYWEARKLLNLMVRYRERLPDLVQDGR